MAIPSDEESHSELVIEDSHQERSQGIAGTGPTSQTTSANPTETGTEADVQFGMEMKQQEQDVGEERQWK